MDVAWMGNRDSEILGEAGQSTVEYILLLAVIIAIATTILNSTKFKNLLGKNGRLATMMKQETEWNYRHGLPGRQQGAIIIRYPNGSHPTYFNAAKGTSHFIGPRDPYPQ